MGLTFRSLFRGGFVVESAVKDDGGFVIAIRGAASVCRCPMCGGVCSRVHSQYRRRLADLPAARRADSADFADPPLLLRHQGLRAANLC